MGSRAGTRTHVFPIPLAFWILWRLVHSLLPSKPRDLWTQEVTFVALAPPWTALCKFLRSQTKANSPLLHNCPAYTFLSPEGLWPALPLSFFTHTLLTASGPPCLIGYLGRLITSCPFYRWEVMRPAIEHRSGPMCKPFPSSLPCLDASRLLLGVGGGAPWLIGLGKSGKREGQTKDLTTCQALKNKYRSRPSGGQRLPVVNGA